MNRAPQLPRTPLTHLDQNIRRVDHLPDPFRRSQNQQTTDLGNIHPTRVFDRRIHIHA